MPEPELMERVRKYRDAAHFAWNPSRRSQAKDERFIAERDEHWKWIVAYAHETVALRSLLDTQQQEIERLTKERAEWESVARTLRSNMPMDRLKALNIRPFKEPAR